MFRFDYELRVMNNFKRTFTKPFHPSILAGILLFSSCCVERTYFPFSNSAPVFDSSNEASVNVNGGIFRVEANAAYAPLNHLALAVNAGARAPVSFRWGADYWQIAPCYFVTFRNHGFELLGGIGQEGARNFSKDRIDTCSYMKSFESPSATYSVTHLDVHYNYLMFQPVCWLKSDDVKFIAAFTLKYLSDPNYSFYHKEYWLTYDSTEIINSINKYDGPLHLLIGEPSLTFRGGYAFGFVCEAKYIFPITGNFNYSQFFRTQKFLLTIGFQYQFGWKKGIR